MGKLQINKKLWNGFKIFIYRYKRQTHSVYVHNSTIPTWLNVTLLKEDLDIWSHVNDFGLKTNVIKMEDYRSKELFLNELQELENSLSSVAELVIKPSSLDNSDSSIIQLKITENVRPVFNLIIATK